MKYPGDGVIKHDSLAVYVVISKTPLVFQLTGAV